MKYDDVNNNVSFENFVVDYFVTLTKKKTKKKNKKYVTFLTTTANIN